ncbi:MAG: hypothetical protein J4452_01230 [Candidatus Aenigmarchaeota archaeon]|nr:hypothetical protein [Candidatus Aenigmarchaeota archaeon]
MNMKSCPKCTREFIDQFNFCPIDGEKLSAQKYEAESEEKNSRREIDTEEYDF